MPSNGTMSDAAINCYMSQETVTALEVESEDVLIIWALTEDGLWQLCVQCDECGCWMLYPWVNHPCTDLETLRHCVEVVNVEMSIETSMDELTEGYP